MPVLALVEFGNTDCALVLLVLIWVKLMLCLELSTASAVEFLHWSQVSTLFICLILYEHIITRALIHYAR